MTTHKFAFREMKDEEVLNAADPLSKFLAEQMRPKRTVTSLPLRRRVLTKRTAWII
jgi:hypothetical protein